MTPSTVTLSLTTILPSAVTYFPDCVYVVGHTVR